MLITVIFWPPLFGLQLLFSSHNLYVQGLQVIIFKSFKKKTNFSKTLEDHTCAQRHLIYTTKKCHDGLLVHNLAILPRDEHYYFSLDETTQSHHAHISVHDL